MRANTQPDTFISEPMKDLANVSGQVQGVADQLAQAVYVLESLAKQQEEAGTQVLQLMQEQKAYFAGCTNSIKTPLVPLG